MKKQNKTGSQKLSRGRRVSNAKDQNNTHRSANNAFQNDIINPTSAVAPVAMNALQNAQNPAEQVNNFQTSEMANPYVNNGHNSNLHNATQGEQFADSLKRFIGGSLEHNDILRCRDICTRINNIFNLKVIGQERLKIALLSALLAKGHILIESVPGLAKTTTASTLCKAISGKFSRIQCTPDLMPNDIVGTQIYNYGQGKFQTQLGPVHANMVLLDEINRSSAKTQSAMLEAMQERQTTIGDNTYPLPNPFMVIATQNPIEEEGTYVLPEAQMDRFLLKEIISYPSPEEEVQMLNSLLSGQLNSPINQPQVSLDDIAYLQNITKQVYVAPALIHYIVSIINTTRGGGPNPIVGLNKLVRVGASPRASIAFIEVCQAFALLNGRSYVLPEDVQDMRYSVLRHRILRTFDAMADDIAVESIIDQVFQVVPVP